MKSTILFIIIFGGACVVNAQMYPWDTPTRPGLWDYPVKPDIEEWKQLKSNVEKVNACQISEEILLSLPTEDLVILCLKYPLFTDIFYFESLYYGLEKLFSDFNGIRELYGRKDISDSLIVQYIQKVQSFSYLDEHHSDLEKGLFTMSVSCLEVLLSRIERRNDSTDNLKEILQCLVAGYEAKCKYPDYFKGTGFRINFFARGHVISKMDQSLIKRLPQKENSAVLFSGRADEASIVVIDELSYQIIK